MPELPEVETIKRGLEKEIVGKKLAGVTITGIRRRAKLLIIDLADGHSFVFHLKLTGQLLFNSTPEKYTRAVFKFDDGTSLVFNDTRKLGWWKKVKDVSKIEREFGPEPLDKTFTLEKFEKMLKARPGAKIKPLLMDQEFIAGIGNIYSDEILFKAGVNPLRQVASLAPVNVKNIFKAVKNVLETAVKHRGSSTRDYLDSYGQKGDFAKYHKVYHKEKCPACGAKIKQVKIGGRSAHYCPICQL